MLYHLITCTNVLKKDLQDIIIFITFIADKDHTLRGKVISKIPENDWSDVPYTPGIELVC